MKFDIQRVRNLTTGILHTEMQHIYEDIESITGTKGVMTHHLGMASTALQPFLKSKITDQRFFDESFDTSHNGFVDIPEMNEFEKSDFWQLFGQQPNPLFGESK